MPPAESAPTRRILSVHGPHPLSGVSTWIARALQGGSTRHEWHALVLGSERELDSMAPFPGAETGRVHTRSWPDDEQASADRVEIARRAFRDIGADVLIPNYVPEAYAAAGLEAPTGARTLGVCHSRDYWYMELIQHAAPLLHGVWAVSKECSGLVASVMPRDVPTLTAPYGTRLPAYTTPPPGVSSPGDPIRLLYTGRLESRQKRVMRLAELAETLTERGAPFELTIAGDGPDRERLAARLGPMLDRGAVRMPGAVPHSQVNDLLVAHDVLVLVSAYEGTPLAAIEAMSLGRPIAVTDACGGATDAVREHGGGVVAPLDDTVAMADAIARLHADRHVLGGLARQAREVAEARFSLARHVCALESLIDEITSADAPDVMAPIEDRWTAVLASLSLAVAGWPKGRGADTIARWRDEWAIAFGRPELVRTLSTDVSHVERLGERLLVAAADELAGEGRSRIAVFPAGRHSTRHGRPLEDRAHVFCFVDDAADDSTARTLHGKPVLSPSAAVEAGIDAVIVSSDQYEEALEARARQWAGDAPVHTLYVPVRIPTELAA